MDAEVLVKAQKVFLDLDIKEVKIRLKSIFCTFL